MGTWARSIADTCKDDIFGYLRTAAAWGVSPRISRVSQDWAGRPAAQEVWRRSLGQWPDWDNGYGRYVSVLVSGESLYATTPGYVFQLDKATGENPAGYNLLKGYDYGDVRLAGDHARVYAGINGWLPAISPESGPQFTTYGTWPRRVLVGTGDQGGRTNVLCEPGLVYASARSFLAKFDPDSGTVMRRTQLRSDALELRLATDGVNVFAASTGGTVYGIQDDTGQQFFKVEMNTPAQAPTTLPFASGLLYAASGGRVTAIDPDGGEVVFMTLVDKAFDPSGPVAIQEMRMDTDGETLFVGANLWVVAIALAS